MNITLPRAVIEQALDALEIGDPWSPTTLRVLKALRTALEQPERKPLTQDLQAPLTLNGVALYPRQHPLTDEKIINLADQIQIGAVHQGHLLFARAIEAAHGIKEDA